MSDITGGHVARATYPRVLDIYTMNQIAPVKNKLPIYIIAYSMLLALLAASVYVGLWWRPTSLLQQFADMLLVFVPVVIYGMIGLLSFIRIIQSFKNIKPYLFWFFASLVCFVSPFVVWFELFNFYPWHWMYYVSLTVAQITGISLYLFGIFLAKNYPWRFLWPTAMGILASFPIFFFVVVLWQVQPVMPNHIPVFPVPYTPTAIPQNAEITIPQKGSIASGNPIVVIADNENHQIWVNSVHVEQCNTGADGFAPFMNNTKIVVRLSSSFTVVPTQGYICIPFGKTAYFSEYLGKLPEWIQIHASVVDATHSHLWLVIPSGWHVVSDP